MRNTNAATWYSSEDWFTHKLEISVLRNNKADKTILFYNDKATNSYEPMYDVTKRKSNTGHPTLATTIGSKELSLNGKNVNNLGEIVPMSLYSGSNGSFELSFEGIETFGKTTIYIKDLQTNTIHNIANGNYTFTANKTDNSERFEIIFIPEIEFNISKVDCEGNLGNISLVSTLGIQNRIFEIQNTTETISSDDLINLNKE